MHSRVATVLACSMAALFAPGARAQDAQPTVIRAARMLDLSSGRMIPNVSVVVTGDRITAVNPATAPAGARVMDLGDVTLMPGFIDLHTHLSGEISATTFIEPVRRPTSTPPSTAAKRARTTVLAGFTTVRDFGGEITVALGKAVTPGRRRARA